ncbi:DUF421 domain-containing protein [Bacillaceae bacterium SIJ1]|uniref:DUF421 domain-containing protein n=1 Tax=Litoribacterium kuwaitense TaxID=1398745 RepID=UPI0013E9C1D4|nr:YetF domain-containing protein [Litoribacterium kuwaitense]NGP46357.1 DUF421 domain-containing protein [Litoribacterium kuwaitense]
MGQEFLLILLRVITILPFLWLVILFMGRRSMQRLPIFDFMIVLAIGSIVGADLADPDIAHWPTITALFLVALLQKVVALSKWRWRRFRKVAGFEPLLVIVNGKLLYKRLQDIQYNPETILSMLREQGVFSVSDVKLGYIEPTGSLSVLKQTPDATFNRQLLIKLSP